MIKKLRKKNLSKTNKKRPDKNAIYLTLEVCYYNYRQTKKARADWNPDYELLMS